MTKRSKVEGPYFAEEIISEILSRLPVKSLAKFKSVSKSWYALISSPFFVKSQHLKQNHVDFMFQKAYTFRPLIYEPPPFATQTPKNRRILLDEDDPIELLATCNGLVCVSDSEDDLYLWNPSTTLSRKIPASTIQFPPRCTHASTFFGLGHYPPSDDYILVRISMFNTPVFQTEVKIYSRNKNTWKSIKDFPYEYPHPKTGVFVQGCLHWLVSCGGDSCNISTLNLSDESYGLINPPAGDSSRVTCYNEIGALGDNLVFFSLDNSCDSYGLWILKEYGKPESWTRIKIAKDEYMIRNEQRFLRFDPFCLSKAGDDEMSFVIDPEGTLVVYDLKEKKCCNVLAPNMEEERSSVFSYVESLVSP